MEVKSPATAVSWPVMFDLDAIPFRATKWPGVSIHFLESDRASGYAAVLIRMEPGSRYPGHRHTDSEEVFVLRGCYADAAGRYPAGSFVRYAAGTAHRPFCPAEAGAGAEAEAGSAMSEPCIFFAIARAGIEVFEAAPS